MTPRKGKISFDSSVIQDHSTSGPDDADSKTKKEFEDLDKKQKEATLTGILQNINERRIYANRIYWLICVWLFGVFILLATQGFPYPRGMFDLDKTVLLSAIGGTTVNVIGIFIIVARYLFPQRPK